MLKEKLNQMRKMPIIDLKMPLKDFIMKNNKITSKKDLLNNVEQLTLSLKIRNDHKQPSIRKILMKKINISNLNKKCHLSNTNKLWADQPLTNPQ